MELSDLIPASRNVVAAFTTGAVIGTLGGLTDNITEQGRVWRWVNRLPPCSGRTTASTC